MKRLLDTNTWIALAIETHPHHGVARAWYDQAFLTDGDLVFCLPTELGFVRLITQATVMGRCGIVPLSNAEAAEFLNSLYHDPAVSRAGEPLAMRALWLRLADRPNAAPNVWMDAYLAAFAITLGAEMVTFDKGFHVYKHAGLALQLLECP
jgi:toxin-antitoxin system PIN domain toxin